jgi:23S rRNA A1618 N6-methylase RlmF
MYHIYINQECLGTKNEMITKGGEVQFVKRMIDESIFLGTQVRYCKMIITIMMKRFCILNSIHIFFFFSGLSK